MRVQLLLARTDGTTRKWKFGHYWLQYSTSITSPTGLRSTVNSISIVSTLSPQDVRTCFVIGNSGHLRLQPSFFAPSREEYSSGIRLAIRRKQLRPLAAKCKQEDSELLWKKIETRKQNGPGLAGSRSNDATTCRRGQTAHQHNGKTTR